MDNTSRFSLAKCTTRGSADWAEPYYYCRKRQLHSQPFENLRHSIARHCANKIVSKKHIAQRLLKHCKKSCYERTESEPCKNPLREVSKIVV